MSSGAWHVKTAELSKNSGGEEQLTSPSWKIYTLNKLFIVQINVKSGQFNANQWYQQLNWENKSKARALN